MRELENRKSNNLMKLTNAKPLDQQQLQDPEIRLFLGFQVSALYRIETQLTQKDSEKLTTIVTRFRYALFLVPPSPPSLDFDPRAMRRSNIMRMTTCTAQSSVSLLFVTQTLSSLYNPSTTTGQRSQVFAPFQVFSSRILMNDKSHFPLLHRSFFRSSSLRDCFCRSTSRRRPTPPSFPLSLPPGACQPMPTV